MFATAIPVVALVTVSVIETPPRLVFNASQSAPIGFYWVADEPVNWGDYAIVRVPERVRNLVEERGYLPLRKPMIKRVVGVEGDEICRRDQEILVNDVTVTVAEWTDELGRLLPVWQGCEVLHSDHIFLLQEHHRSFDGRYFGPVNRCLIIGRATRWRLPWRGN